MSRINLGCGEDLLKDGVNVDLYNSKADLKHDLRLPLPFPDNSVDWMQALNIVEHFSRREWDVIRKDWYRVLKYGGYLWIKIPDFFACAKEFIRKRELGEWDSQKVMSIFGGQQDEGQFHKQGFDAKKISESLEEVGFKVMKCVEKDFGIDIEVTK